VSNASSNIPSANPPPAPSSSAANTSSSAVPDPPAVRSHRLTHSTSTVGLVPSEDQDDQGVGTGGDKLTALPVISNELPGAPRGSPESRRKRLSSGGRLLVKPGGPGLG
jgi:hypothetical protein